MALPPFNSQAKTRDRVIAIDPGGRTTKAVHVQRKGESFVLAHHALLDAPIYEKNLSVDLLGEHLKAVCQALETKTRPVSIAVSVGDSIVRHAEVSPMRLEDLRQILKNNTMYLQQDRPVTQVFVDGLPVVGGFGDAGGNGLGVFDLLQPAAQEVGFEESRDGLVFEHEWEHGDAGAQRDARPGSQ